ncbi:Uncharacterized membrane protein, DUF441 family [Formivibrio citricus]|uniref:UPF0756 membrane protein SAMN05660284_01769 n=1 Tax=Formivibrio citricus TaxID=83765 RepID=A0A1I5A1L0_9NEIS|nr:DUF441 domain-containing protein [Formivibrio citricus]SFN56287.1 Uncharacterized membrane protein, DUF441 family [Formivibrio citricus]
MNLENLPILIILFISVLGNNHTVSIAAMALLLIKLLGLHRWLDVIEANGIMVGVTILTAAVLVPVVTGRMDVSAFAKVFKSPTGILALGIGLALAWIAAQGVPYMKASPEAVTALMVGTLVGVCFFRGLAVGPLIAGGMVALLVRFLKL